MSAHAAEPYLVDEASGCWLWQRYIDPNGYGRIYFDRRIEWAHRAFYLWCVGPIPEGLQLDHLCSNPPCVNPDHLEPVTQTENVRRSYARRGFGEVQLRAGRLRSEGLTYREIAEVLGFTSNTRAMEAVQSAIRKGLIDPADVPPVKRVTADEREDIKALHAMGIAQTEIGRWYSLDGSQVCRIVAGRTSGHRSRESA